MKKLSLITEFEESYKGSDLQKIVNNNPLPIKYTIDGFDCYFYNADLFGFFEWKIQKDGITTSDFINDYRNGFKSGLLHLKELEKIKLKDLKSKDLREGTILQLKYILHERDFKLGSKGLLDLVFNKVPLIFTEKNIFDYGYWNGIIYSIDDIIEKAGLTLDELKTSEPQQPEKVNDKADLYLKDFLVNPSNEYKLPEIQQKFNTAIGKEMANAIYLLRYLGILTYDINNKTKGRKKLAELLNPNIKMNGVNMFFESGTYELKNAFDDDLDPIKKWLNGL